MANEKQLTATAAQIDDAVSKRHEHSNKGVLDGITAEKAAGWDGKQEAISDLATIRSGAALGATALQSVPNTYRTASEQEVIDAGKYEKPAGGIPSTDLTAEVQAAIAKAAAIGAVWTLKGTVASAGLLPGSGNTIGDVYYVSDESVGYVWLNDGSTDRWEQLGPTVNTSAFIKTTASGAQQITANSPTVLALKNAATLAAQQGKAYIKMVDHDGSAIGYMGLKNGKLSILGPDGVTEPSYRTASEQDVIDAGKADKVTVTAADNGKFMRVVNGAWAAVSVPAAEEASF